VIFRKTIRGIRMTLSIARVTQVIGVNSMLDDGRHILMWDFDEVSLGHVKDALRIVQTRYFLSDIHIFKTSEPDNYIAYCFTAVDWRRAVEIVAVTYYVDWQFLRFGVYRGHFTLRVSPKTLEEPKPVFRIEGMTLSDVKPEELKSWVRYQTLRR